MYDLGDDATMVPPHRAKLPMARMDSTQNRDWNINGGDCNDEHFDIFFRVVEARWISLFLSSGGGVINTDLVVTLF